MKLINKKNNTPLSKRTVFSTIILSILAATANSSMASQTNISASFTPNPLDVNSNTFKNTTPNSGYCATYSCPNGSFSISIPNETSYTALEVGKRFEFKVPYDWRDVQVTNSDGTSKTVQIRITGMGSRYQVSSKPQTITGISGILDAHYAVWNSGWVNAPSGCSSTGVGGVTAWAYTYFWKFNSANACTKTSQVSEQPGVYFTATNIMYELKTPDPINMSAGTYTGSITYKIGPTGDFKLGETTASDPDVTLNLKLSVNHIFNLRFPPGSNFLTLEPKEGWQQWLYNGPKHLPTKLLAHQDFQQWSSTKFKMQLQCQYFAGTDCAIQNNSGTTQIPVKTSVTLPSSLEDTSKQPVNRYPLSTDIPAIFQPSRYVNNERSTLNFEVDKAGVEQMVNSGGGRFHGDVTVIWDSQI